MADFRIVSSIDAIGREAWSTCFPDELEGFDYLRAVEHSGTAGFRWCYLAAYAEGILQAALPAFLNGYALDTTLDGTAKKLSSLLRSHFPSAFTLKLACIGSPVTEYGLVGFNPSVGENEKPALLAGMLARFEQFAGEQGHNFVGLKDVPEFQQALWQTVLAHQGYRTIPSLPVASIDIDFATMEDYFATLSRPTRKGMRRKLKSLDGLRIEYRTSINDVLPQIMALYRDTRDRADLQFEELTEDYFTQVLEGMPGRVFCVLYFAGDDLLAANLLLKNETTLLDKFFCMDGARGREHNLYFVSWFTNLAYCLEHGLARYQSGQAGYEVKLSLGSKLTPTFMHFKHRNRWIQGALRLAAPFLAPDIVQEAA